MKLTLLCSVLLACTVLAVERPLVPPAILDLPLQPTVINTNPGPEYSEEQRDYAMVIGMDRTPKGRLWAAWVGGGDSPRAYFVAATSDDDGATWSKPRLVIDPPDAPTALEVSALVGNFWTDPTGRLWLFYDQSLAMFDGRAGLWAITCDNPDDETPVWSAPRRIWHGMTLNKPTVLKSGEWLLPISLWTRGTIGNPDLRDAHHDLDNQRMAHLFVSTDQGQTWSRRGGVAFPQTQFDEHMVVELKDGRLWMMARTNYGMAEAFSTDAGRTWSEPQPSKIQNPSARFFLRRLASGNLLLVKNGPIEQRLTGRSHMTAFLSEDEGQTWTGGLVLDERNGVSYPDGFQAPDGVIHIIHDRERSKEREILMARFREEDVKAAAFTTPGAQGKIMVSKALGKRIGDRLYNGVQLPGEWPPRTQDPKSTEPMATPWMSERPKVIPINVGRQLFVDDYLIEKTTLQRVFHLPTKHEGNPVFKAETAAELNSTGLEGNQQAVTYLGHGGVFFDPTEKLFKMYYTAGWRGGLGLATSPDLLTWTRPELNLTGSNLLLAPGRENAGGDNAMWLDLSAKNPAERLKFMTDRKPHQLQISADGREWSAPVSTGKAGDYCSFFYNPFRKVWVYSIKQGGPRGRSRYYAESGDFLKGASWQDSVYWTNADQLDEADPQIGDAPQLYSLNAVAYESILLGQFYILLGPDNKICNEGKFPKVTELKMGFSRDGFHWHRPDRRAFIGATRKEGDWDRAYLHGTMGVCMVRGEELWFPYCAYSGQAPSGVRGMYTGASIGLARLRRDGFASMEARGPAGSLTTRPVAFNGSRLFVNAACAGGELRAEILDEAGQVIAPFTAENCIPMTADATRQELRWKGVEDFSAVSGKPVRFRFHLKEGQLYAFWVSHDAQGASRGYVGAGGPDYPGVMDTVGGN